jgi:Fe2+ transport system protein B
MELPSYRIPDIKSVWIGLLDRAKIFLKRVGGLSSLYRSCLVLVYFPSTA